MFSYNNLGYIDVICNDSHLFKQRQPDIYIGDFTYLLIYTRSILSIACIQYVSYAYSYLWKIHLQHTDAVLFIKTNLHIWHVD